MVIVKKKPREKIRIGISSCLIGNKVRYDGSHKRDRYIVDTLGRFFEWVSVCPEVEYGLPVPREAMRLERNPGSPRIVTISTGIDHTEGMLRWARKKLKDIESDNLCGFIFKSRSPSSGIRGVKVYANSKLLNRRGIGIFGAAFIEHFPLMPVIDDDMLHDPRLRKKFMERVLVYFQLTKKKE